MSEFWTSGIVYMSNIHYKHGYSVLKGCGMGPWLVLVSHCFRENVVATSKIVSSLCSLDNLPQKNIIVLGKSILQVPDTGTSQYW